jgi:hypothetical protein
MRAPAIGACAVLLLVPFFAADALARSGDGSFNHSRWQGCRDASTLLRTLAPSTPVDTPRQDGVAGDFASGPPEAYAAGLRERKRNVG